MLMNNNEYLDLVQTIKQEIQQAQYKATLSVNKELIMLYYNIGKIINEHKSWGNKFIENLAADIKLSFPNARAILFATLNICQNLQALILMSNLCRRCLHKFRGRTMLQFWIRLKEKSKESGIYERPQKMAGRIMS